MRVHSHSPVRMVPAAVAVLVLSGCTVGPDFHRPLTASPTIWQSELADVGSRTVPAPVDPQWWNSFGDPELSSLVRRLVAQNLDLQAAAERIMEERAQRQVAAAQGLPQINEQSSAQHERQSPSGFLSLVQPAPYAPLTYDSWQNGLSSSWELDLFGRVRRAVEADDAQTLASVENRHGIALSALAELAQDYLQLRGTQAQLAVARANLAVATEDAGLTRTRLAIGVANTLDVAQAEARQAAITASVPPLVNQQTVLINTIGLLLAEPPHALQAELQPPVVLAALPHLVPVGVPADLIRRRPDVREAEARLHAATAQVGVAVADFYPDISLTGAFNEDGRIIANAFSLPARAFQVGPSISIPLFQGGKLRGQLRLRRAQQREAAIAFQRTLLQAWMEVDNALTTYAQAQKRRDAIIQTEVLDQTALAAARQRYLQGVADFLNVNATQQQLLQSQQDLAVSRTEIMTDLVSLYRALGGGWQVADTAPR